MAYGLQISDSSGNLLFDSTNAPGGWVAGVEQSQTVAFYQSYSQYAGLTGYSIVMGDGVPPTWDYTLGYPRVYIPADFLASSRKVIYLNFVK